MGSEMCIRDRAVMDLTNGEGADVVIEAVGSTTTLNQVLHLVRQGGQIVLFGLPISKNPVPFDFSTFFVRCVNAFSILDHRIIYGNNRALPLCPFCCKAMELSCLTLHSIRFYSRI